MDTLPCLQGEGGIKMIIEHISKNILLRIEWNDGCIQEAEDMIGVLTGDIKEYKAIIELRQMEEEKAK